MSELNVGDYVRTKHRGFQPPQIAKIKSMKRDAGYNNQYYIELDHNLLPDYNFYIYEEDVAKTSPNIIDLIQMGDYVNGQKVFDKLYDEKNVCWYLKLEIGEVFGKYARTYEQHIKSIVTKESFENISYEVGE